MNSVLTQCKQDGQMNKIDIPQVLVSYAGGSGGEWLALQLSKHDKYAPYSEGEIEGDANELNRWRIRGSWRAHMMDETEWKDETWTEVDYDNSKEWWDDFWLNAPSTEKYYQQVRDLTNSKPRYRIPLHRCHEAWYDQYWADLFEEYKTVSIYINDKDHVTMKQFQGNIIKKIFWQDLSNPEDLADELIDKCRKHRVDYDETMSYINKFSLPINYTDMMLGVYLAQDGGEYDTSVNNTMEMLAQRWNNHNITQHHYPVGKDWHSVNFKRMFIDKEFDEYRRLCEFLGCTPWDSSEWNKVISDYADQDMQQVITVQEVEARLWARIQEIM